MARTHTRARGSMKNRRPADEVLVRGFFALTASIAACAGRWVPRQLLRGGAAGGGGVLAAGGLDHHAVADRLGADLDPHDPAVDHGADLLDVGLELAGGDPGHLRADPAEVLGL